MKTIHKALLLLKAIAEKPLSVTEASVLLNIHISTVSRLLSTMREEGFVELTAHRKYEIGQAVFLLTKTVSANEKIKNIAHPFLYNLNKKIDETVHLSVLDANKVVYIDKIDSSKLIRLHSTIGAYNPIYCTGVGKALLAYQPPERIKRIISRIKFEQFTANTITSSEQLLQELKKIKDTGVSYDFEEHTEAVNCIAIPIFGNTNHVVASISIAAPQFSTSKENLLRYKEDLLQVANTISKNLGYTGTIPPK